MTEDWTALCRHLVPEVLLQRGWHLITAENLPGFTEAVRGAIIEGTVKPRPGAPPEATVKRATIHLYCHELYGASGENGTLRQRQAFEEIGRHAQGVAYRSEQDTTIIQECVQQSLEIVWEKRSQVRQPGSFLRWVESIVYHEIINHWPSADPRVITMSQLASDGNEMDDESLLRYWESLATVSPPDDDVVRQEQRDQIRAALHRVLGDNPRYEAVIVGYYLYELSLPALAEMLGTSVGNVYVLKSRALSRLRDDEEFVREFADTLEEVSGGKR
jgi:RNA polymerase sigma factor (sigma-70 family)